METAMSKEEIANQKRLGKNRISLKKHRDKIKLQHGTTYYGAQKQALTRFNLRLKELKEKYKDEFFVNNRPNDKQ